MNFLITHWERDPPRELREERIMTEIKCETCNGSGWGVKENVSITAPITGSKISLKNLMEYIKGKLLCSDCNGTGKKIV